MRKGAPEGRVAPACRLVGFGNLRARAEAARSGPSGTRKVPNAMPASQADTCETCLDLPTLFTWRRRASGRICSGTSSSTTSNPRDHDVRRRDPFHPAEVARVIDVLRTGDQIERRLALSLLLARLQRGSWLSMATLQSVLRALGLLGRFGLLGLVFVGRADVGRILGSLPATPSTTERARRAVGATSPLTVTSPACRR